MKMRHFKHQLNAKRDEPLKLINLINVDGYQPAHFAMKWSHVNS